MAKPKLALIPAAQGSKFYSVLPSDGVGDFDFARASAATRINKYGLIETVASGQSRLNYPLIDGVVNGCPSHLLEPQRINLVTYSEDFSNAAWTKSGSTITSNAAISPDGSLNADKLIENTANSVHQISLFKSASVNDYSFSVFVKKGEREFVSLVFSDNVRYLVHYTFDLTNGVVTKSYNYTGVTSVFTSKSIGNGWYKLTLSSNYTWSTLIYSRIYIENTSTPPTVPSNTYIGDGTSGLYIWGAQLEAGSYPTSYIVSNSGSATTRVAETANNSGDASTFNDSEGVLMAEISAFEYPITQNNWLTITDGSINNSIGIVFESTTVVARHEVGGVNYSYLTHVIDYTNVLKIAFKYKLNDLQLWINGYKVSVLSSSPIFPNNTLNSLQLQYGGGSNTFYSNIKQIQYYDSALNDSELETLTSWTSFSEMATSQLYSIQ